MLLQQKRFDRGGCRRYRPFVSADTVSTSPCEADETAVCAHFQGPAWHHPAGQEAVVFGGPRRRWRTAKLSRRHDGHGGFDPRGRWYSLGMCKFCRDAHDKQLTTLKGGQRSYLSGAQDQIHR